MSAYEQIMAARRSVPKRDRDRIVAWVAYQCHRCGIDSRFAVCVGVYDPDHPNDVGVPAPRNVPCRMCGEQMIKSMGMSTVGPIPSHLPRLRVPSRRAAIAIAMTGEVHAQVVDTEETW